VGGGPPLPLRGRHPLGDRLEAHRDYGEPKVHWKNTRVRRKLTRGEIEYLERRDEDGKL
jgi:hypothetical protein